MIKLSSNEDKNRYVSVFNSKLHTKTFFDRYVLQASQTPSMMMTMSSFDKAQDIIFTLVSDAVTLDPRCLLSSSQQTLGLQIYLQYYHFFFENCNEISDDISFPLQHSYTCNKPWTNFTNTCSKTVSEKPSCLASSSKTRILLLVS